MRGRVSRAGLWHLRPLRLLLVAVATAVAGAVLLGGGPSPVACAAVARAPGAADHAHGAVEERAQDISHEIPDIFEGSAGGGRGGERAAAMLAHHTGPSTPRRVRGEGRGETTDTEQVRAGDAVVRQLPIVAPTFVSVLPSVVANTSFVVATWTSVPSAATYEVEILQLDPLRWVQVADTAALSETIDVTEPLMEVTYLRVRGVNALGDGPYSDVVNVFTPHSPDTAVRGEQGVQLLWQNVPTATPHAVRLHTFAAVPPSPTDTVVLTVTVPPTVTSLVSDVRITLPLHFEDAQFMTATLSKGGTTVTLFNYVLTMATRIVLWGDYTLSDAASTSWWGDAISGTYTRFSALHGLEEYATPSTWNSFEALSAFANEPAAGVWTLTIAPGAYTPHMVGEVGQWSLSLQDSVSGLYSDFFCDELVALPTAVIGTVTLQQYNADGTPGDEIDQTLPLTLTDTGNRLFVSGASNRYPRPGDGSHALIQYAATWTTAPGGPFVSSAVSGSVSLFFLERPYDPLVGSRYEYHWFLEHDGTHERNMVPDYLSASRAAFAISPGVTSLATFTDDSEVDVVGTTFGPSLGSGVSESVPGLFLGGAAEVGDTVYAWFDLSAANGTSVYVDFYDTLSANCTEGLACAWAPGEPSVAIGVLPSTPVLMDGTGLWYSGLFEAAYNGGYVVEWLGDPEIVIVEVEEEVPDIMPEEAVEAVTVALTAAAAGAVVGTVGATAAGSISGTSMAAGPNPLVLLGSLQRVALTASLGVAAFLPDTYLNFAKGFRWAMLEFKLPFESAGIDSDTEYIVGQLFIVFIVLVVLIVAHFVMLVIKPNEEEKWNNTFIGLEMFVVSVAYIGVVSNGAEMMVEHTFTPGFRVLGVLMVGGVGVGWIYFVRKHVLEVLAPEIKSLYTKDGVDKAPGITRTHVFFASIRHQQYRKRGKWRDHFFVKRYGLVFTDFTHKTFSNALFLLVWIAAFALVVGGLQDNAESQMSLLTVLEAAKLVYIVLRMPYIDRLVQTVQIINSFLGMCVWGIAAGLIEASKSEAQEIARTMLALQLLAAALDLAVVLVELPELIRGVRDGIANIRRLRTRFKEHDEFTLLEMVRNDDNTKEIELVKTYMQAGKHREATAVLMRLKERPHKNAKQFLTEAEVAELCEEVAAKVGNKKLVLNFSTQEYNLTNVDFLKFVDTEKYRLIRLNLAHNQITDTEPIDEVGEFLMHLDLTNNSVGPDFTLRNCPRLQWLSLERNKLVLFPDVRSPYLKELYLQKNTISNDWASLADLENLVVLDMSHNALDWNRTDFVKGCQNTLSGWTKMQELTMAHNPVCGHKKFYETVTRYNRKIKVLNGHEVIDGKILGESDDEEEDVDAIMHVARGNTPTVVELTRVLEDIGSNKLRASDGMQQVRTGVEAMVAHPDEIFEGIFQHDAILIATAQFLEQVTVLVEQQPLTARGLVWCTAQLCLVRQGKMCNRALEQLTVWMESGYVMREIVMDTILDVMVPLLQHNMMTDTRDLQLLSLAQVTDFPDVSEILRSRGVIPLLSQWVEAEGDVSSPNEPLIKIVASVCKDRRNAREMTAHISVVDQLINWLHKADLQSKLYVYLLEISVRICAVDTRGNVVRKYKDATMHQTLKAHVRGYKSAGGWTTQSWRMAGQEIALVDAMCSNPEVYRDVWKEMATYLTQIAQWNNVHPRLLAPSLNMLAHLLYQGYEWVQTPPKASAKDIAVTGRTTARSWESIYKELLNILTHQLTPERSASPLLEFVDGHRYVQLLRAAGVGDEGRGVSLDVLSDRTVSDAIVALLNLMTFFHDHYDDDDRCRNVCDAMDEADRDPKLFALLKVRDDEVKLAAIHMLVVVGTALAADEVETVVKIVTECDDLTAGRTEEVIGGCLVILGMFAQLETPAGEAFRREHSDVIVTALEVMLENCSRDTTGDRAESKDKAVLMKDCVFFLNATKKWEVAHDLMASPEVQSLLVQILLVEHKYGTYEDIHGFDEDPPICVETTPVGCDIKTLLTVMHLNVDPPITMDTPVGARLLNRCAVLLEGPQGLVLDEMLAEQQEKMGEVQDEDHIVPEDDVLLRHMLHMRRRDRIVQELLTEAKEDKLLKRALKQHRLNVLTFNADTQDGGHFGNDSLQELLVRSIEPTGLLELDLFHPQRDPTVRELVINACDSEQRRLEDLRALEAELAEEGVERELIEQRQAMREAEDVNSTNRIVGWHESNAAVALAEENLLKTTTELDTMVAGRGVSAMMRALLAAMWYGGVQTRATFLSSMRQARMWRPLALMMYRMGWTSQNMGVKLCLLLEEVVRTPPSQQREQEEALQPYNVIMRVVQSMVFACNHSMKATGSMMPKEELLFKRAAGLAALVCRQVTNIDYRNYDAQVNVVAHQVILLNIVPLRTLRMYMRFLFVDQQRQRNTTRPESSASAIRHMLCREHVFTILSEYLTTSPDHLYELWELVFRMESQQGAQLQASYVCRVGELFTHRYIAQRIEERLELGLAEGLEVKGKERVVEWAEAYIKGGLAPSPGRYLLVLTHRRIHVFTLKLPRRRQLHLTREDMADFHLGKWVGGTNNYLRLNAQLGYHRQLLALSRTTNNVTNKSIIAIDNPDVCANMFDAIQKMYPAGDHAQTDQETRSLLQSKMYQPYEERVLMFTAVRSEHGTRKVLVLSVDYVYVQKEHPDRWRHIEGSTRYLMSEDRYDLEELGKVRFGTNAPTVSMKFDDTDLRVIMPSYAVQLQWQRALQRAVEMRRQKEM